MIVHRLLRVSVTVRDLGAMAAFHEAALGFMAEGPALPIDPAIQAVLGAPGRFVRLRRGAQVLELVAFDTPGAAYPEGSRANDLWFQHCALPTDDIGAAYAALAGHGITPISRNGPVTLPGGIVAFKFRDPEGHPLELIQFPQPKPATANGIDHSAIAVSDAGRANAFYTGLGLTVGSRQVNTGPAQDALDGLDRVTADVVALTPPHADPHIELLGYRFPPGRRGVDRRPRDIASARLVLAVDTLPDGRPILIHDPDGHSLLLVAQ